MCLQVCVPWEPSPRLRRKPGWGAAGLENLICWEDGATLQAAPGFSVFCSLFVAVLGNRKPTYLHGLLLTKQASITEVGRESLATQKSRKHREKYVPAEAGWNSWEKPINAPLS